MESMRNIYDRAQAIKVMLSKFKEEVTINGNRDKILIVTHAKTLRALISSGLDPEQNCPVPNYIDGELIDAHNPKNCEIIPFDIGD